MTVIAYDPYLVASRARSLQVELADELAHAAQARRLHHRPTCR